MTVRPAPLSIIKGLEDWDDTVATNFATTFSKPFAAVEHTGDETDLESTFPAAQHVNCLAWMNHTFLGWSCWCSNGTAWLLFYPQPIAQSVYIQEFGTPVTSTGVLSFNGAVTDASLGSLPWVGTDGARAFAWSSVWMHGDTIDPGDWTLTVTNVPQATNATGTIPLNDNAGGGFTPEVSEGRLSSVLDFAAGEHPNMTLAGPSTAGGMYGELKIWYLPLFEKDL